MRAAVLAAEGPVFCAGADLAAVAAGDIAGIDTARGGFAGFVFRERSKPFVAAVDGRALGGGCELALACDLVVAGTDAVFGLPEVRRSLVAGAGGLMRLPLAVGRAVAAEVALTGNPLPARRAYDLGFVNRVVATGTAVEEAVAVAGEIAANAPLAVQASLRLLRLSGSDEAEQRRRTMLEVETLMTTRDFGEGPTAFLEKRQPRWTGT